MKYKNFSVYLEECQKTWDALSAFERAVQAKYDNHGYPYIAGYMMMQYREVIAELPRKRREEIQARFLREAQKFEQEHLMKTIKEA